MNPGNLKEAEKLLGSLKPSKDAETVIAPPFPYLFLLKDSPFVSAAQNCYFKKEGAFTGEISPSMLKSLGCKYVLVGHSERREFFKENEKDISLKIEALKKEALIPVFCLGEKKEDRDEGNMVSVIKKQLRGGLEGISLKNIVIAYEPVWAIGTGNPCDIDTAFKMRLLIKKIIREMAGDEADRVSILYGGSVNGENYKKYLEEAGFDGLLIGGASLKADQFQKIISYL